METLKVIGCGNTLVLQSSKLDQSGHEMEEPEAKALKRSHARDVRGAAFSLEATARSGKIVADRLLKVSQCFNLLHT